MYVLEFRLILAPSDFIASIVQITSVLPRSPSILLSPIAIEDRITHLWEIDLSPGAEISPRNPLLRLEVEVFFKLLFFLSYHLKRFRDQVKLE